MKKFVSIIVTLTLATCINAQSPSDISKAESQIIKQLVDRYYAMHNQLLSDETKLENKILKKFQKAPIYATLSQDVADAICKGVIMYECDSIILNTGNNGIHRLKNKDFQDSICKNAIVFANRWDDLVKGEAQACQAVREAEEVKIKAIKAQEESKQNKEMEDVRPQAVGGNDAPVRLNLPSREEVLKMMGASNNTNKSKSKSASKKR